MLQGIHCYRLDMIGWHGWHQNILRLTESTNATPWMPQRKGPPFVPVLSREIFSRVFTCLGPFLDDHLPKIVIDGPFRVNNGHLLLLTIFKLVGNDVHRAVHLHSTMETKQLDWKRHFLLDLEIGVHIFLRNCNRPIESLPIEHPISGVHALRG
jgi:hypothetical protein